MNAAPLQIFQPLTVLVFWTMLVLLQIPIRRFRAGFKGEVRADDFRHGESARVPPHVSIPNRNYMNLLELPVLFYAVCLVLVQMGWATHVDVSAAWVFVGLRALHSAVHCTINIVVVRFVAYLGASLALWFMLGRLAMRLW